MFMRPFIAFSILCGSLGLLPVLSLNEGRCWGQGGTWLTFEKCAVREEHRVEIPSQERGILKLLAVELNQAVVADEVLAELDTDMAELDLRVARLEQLRAEEMAKDDADVKLQEIALQQVEEELRSYRSISNSVSESEIRRLSLGVEQAKVAVIRAGHVRNRAISDAKLKAAAVEAAQLRLLRRRIIAPCNGVVTAIKTHPGQSIEAGQTVMEIEVLERLVIDRLIPIEQVNAAELVGAEVRVDVPIPGGESVRLAGEVTSCDPRVSSGGLVRVHARVKNVTREGHWVLLPGREVTMHVASGGASQSAAAKVNVRR